MLEQLKRRSALDPQNKTLQLNVVAAMAREGRSSELVAPLMDRGVWNQAGEYAQGLAAREVERRIGEGWVLSGMRVWSCEVFDIKHYGTSKPAENLSYTISHRLARFIHKPSGIEFQLLPGRPPKTVIDVGPEECKLMNWEASQVTITDPAKPPFLIARWPVTNDQAWRTHMRNGLGEDGMYDTESSKGPLPATGASFDEVKEYAEHNGFSLPTPDQWEYACKAGSTTRFYWGDEFDPSHVWYAENSWEWCSVCRGSGDCSGGFPCRGTDQIPHGYNEGVLRSRGPQAPAEHDKAGRWNSHGLVDMIGNVSEFNDLGEINGGNFTHGDYEIDIYHSRPTGGHGNGSRTIGFRPVKKIDWSE